ncbi:MAG: hypothetical protein AB7J32_10865 [Pseudonocardia sp.]
MVRWMWTWIALGILVVVVVIGFLIGITRALSSIDGGLFEAASSVENIGTNADPLPDALQKINEALTSIDETLKPVPGQATEIDAGLIKVKDSLAVVGPSLADTATSLVDTNTTLANTAGNLVHVAEVGGKIDSSLADTTDILKVVLDRARAIDDKLEGIQSEDSDGTADIVKHIDIANGALGNVRDDTKGIVGGLKDVNKNLSAICGSPLLVALPPGQC